MNKARRKEIAEIVEQLEALKERAELLQEEEQEAFDNLPESLQQAERGQAMEEAVNELANATYSIDEAIAAIRACMKT